MSSPRPPALRLAPNSPSRPTARPSPCPPVDSQKLSCSAHAPLGQLFAHVRFFALQSRRTRREDGPPAPCPSLAVTMKGDASDGALLDEADQTGRSLRDHFTLPSFLHLEIVVKMTGHGSDYLQKEEYKEVLRRLCPVLSSTTKSQQFCHRSSFISCLVALALDLASLLSDYFRDALNELVLERRSVCVSLLRR